MRKVGDMRVGPSAKTVHEEKVKHEAIKAYKASFEESYEKAKEGIVEWIGEREMPDEAKDHDQDGHALIYVLSAKKESETGKYHTMELSYDRRPIFEIDHVMKEMNVFLEGEKYLSRIFLMREDDVRRDLEDLRIEMAN